MSLRARRVLRSGKILVDALAAFLLLATAAVLAMRALPVADAAHLSG